MYVYRHEFVDPTRGTRRVRQWILAVVELEPFGTGILPHERTHARAKADRLSLTRAVGANLSPIFSLYEDPQSAVAPILTAATAELPRLALSGEDGDQHTVWSITDVQRFRDLARALSNSPHYIDDSHHRYETSPNYRDKARSQQPKT